MKEREGGREAVASLGEAFAPPPFLAAPPPPFSGQQRKIFPIEGTFCKKFALRANCACHST
ncbi:MAG: hypothetical protein GY820_37070 [Gammaproteobacteria bacterium]|nr:hypothetical protein [Gammaproteobacteria bacterium]